MTNMFLNRSFRGQVLGPLVATLLLISTTLVGTAANVTVDQDGNGDFTTIADALAAVNPGDVITVNPGTYNETLTLPIFSLTIQSSDPTDPNVVLATRINPTDQFGFILDGNQAGNQTVINGFVIDGNGDSTGLSLRNGSSVIVENCIIAGHKLAGAAVKGDSNVTFRKCVFASNDHDESPGGEPRGIGSGFGGAINCCDSTCVVEECDFSSNCSELGGGAIFAVSSSLVILDCDFNDNKTGAFGGAVSAVGASNVIQRGNNFANNQADLRGGSINYRETSESTDAPRKLEPISTAAISQYFGGKSPLQRGQPVYEISDCTFESNVCLGGLFRDGGGAITCDNTSPLISNCTFITNDVPMGQGGAILNINGASPIISNCNFLGNTALVEGGAIKSRDASSPALLGCTFQMNATTNDTSHRGGAINSSGSMTTIDNCTFVGNASATGGAIYNEQDFDGNFGILDLSNCDFGGNSAENGGAIFNFIDISNVTLSECNFDGNMATLGRGGAVFNRSMVAATDNVFEGNVAEVDGGAVHNDAGASFEFSDCNFTSNIANTDDGGAIHSIGDESKLLGCVFNSNHCGDNGGAVFLNGAPTVVQFCKFLANDATDLGGGIASFNASNEVVINSSFYGCSAGLAGGGSATFDSSPMYFGCQFNGNTAGIDGGGIAHVDSISNITNCSFTLNSAENAGGAVSGVGESVLTVTNSILWENGDVELFVNETSSQNVSFSILQIAEVGGGTNLDPLFVDPLGLDGTAGTGDENMALQSGSPAIDAGNNSAVPVDQNDIDSDGDLTEAMPLDLEMNLRFVDNPKVADTGSGDAPLVDIGAFEFSPGVLLGDVNLDGAVNLLDVDPFVDRVGTSTFQPEADINQDGQVNLLDVDPFIEVLGGT